MLLLVQLRAVHSGLNIGRHWRIPHEQEKVPGMRSQRRKVAIPRKFGKSIRVVSHSIAHFLMRCSCANRV